MPGDTLGTVSEAPAAAPTPPMDTVVHDTSTAAAVPRERASTAPHEQVPMSPKPAVVAPTPTPTTPAPTPPKPDTPVVKPNVDPRRIIQTPRVPKPSPHPSQDTAARAAAPENAPLRDQYHQAPRDTVSPVVYNGWKQFNLNCARCHGEDVLGTTIAPHLILSLKPDGPINTKELFVQTVCHGRPEKGMPAWCTLGLDNDRIEQIYAYVKGRSDGKIGPGRPAVR